MKTIILVRHAKSSWEDPAQPDFERTLNERGKKNAAEMAIRLKAKIPQVDLFVSSSAKRARKTAEFFAKEFKTESDHIILVPELYHAEPANFRDVIAGLDDKFQSAALFSHNPGISYYVNQLTEVRLDHMPTCGVFAVESEAMSWADFAASPKAFLFFDYPKADQG